MLKTTVLQLLAQRRRLAGIGLAISISAGFLAMTMLFGTVIDQGFRNAVGSEYRHIDFVVEGGERPFTNETIAGIEGLDGVADVQPATAPWLTMEAQGRRSGVAVAPVPDDGPLRDDLELSSGRLPESAGEIVLDRATAREMRIEEGEPVTLFVPQGTDGRSIKHDLTLVGIWSSSGRFGSEEFGGLLHPDDHALWFAENWISSLYVVAEPGADPAVLELALLDAAGPDASVVPASEMIDRELEERAEETAIQNLGVNAFAVLTLVVAGIVVSNTFTILVAQRTREIALLRCAGATSGQVRRMILIEAGITGAIASAAGVVGALAVANLALWVIDAMFDYRNIPARTGMPGTVAAIPFVAGVGLAMIAAWAATRIDPLQALRVAQSPVGAGQRAGAVRIGISTLCLAGGAMLLLGGAAVSHAGSREAGVLIGMMGGITSFLGVLVGASVLVPATVAGFGRVISRVGGVPARVAASNSVRNPRRTTATTIALVIGVALVTMMSVGAESLKATMFDEIDAATPWDVSVFHAGEQEAASSFDTLAVAASHLDGVDAAVTLDRIEIEIPGQDGGDAVGGEAHVVDADALAAVWRDTRSIEGFGAGTALVPSSVTDLTGVDDGETFTITASGKAIDVEAIASDHFDSIVISREDANSLDVAPVSDSIRLRLAEDADPDAVIDQIYTLADEGRVSIDVTGMSSYRETLTTALDALLLVITALLGVAVLIAIIGVGNTLTLSVIERTQESALLRALGFTRRQLRQSLAVEGALLAAIGSVIGIALGAVFGWIGAITVVGNAWPVALAFPVGRIGLIVAVAIGCGLIASILPARRAAEADPIVALAES